MLKLRILCAAWLVGAFSLALLFGGCATSPKLVPDEYRSLTLPNNNVIQHPYYKGRPLSATNAWARAEIVDFVVGEDAAMVSWQFAVSFKTNGIERVDVYQMGEPTRKFEFEENLQAILKQGWVGRMNPYALTPSSEPWLFEPGDGINYFVFILTHESGERNVLYQPVFHTQEFKRQAVNLTHRYAMSDLLLDYELPPSSIAPTKHPDQNLDAAIRVFEDVAEAQNLIFDGTRAQEGYVILGKMGSTDQMVIGVKFFIADDQVGFSDVHHWKASDMREGTRMREALMRIVRE